MADNVIQVGATVDLSELKQLTTQSDAVADAYRRLAEAQLEANNSAMVARNTLRALGTGELPAVKAVMQDYANELRQSAVASDALKEAQANVAAATTQVTVETEKASLSMLQYRQAAQLAGREIGVTLPRALTSLAIQSEGVRNALQAAFSGIVALAFINILVQLTQKLTDFVAETFIFTQAERDADSALKASNQRLEEYAQKIKSATRELQLHNAQSEEERGKLKLGFQIEDQGGSAAQLKKQFDDAKQAVADFQKETETVFVNIGESSQEMTHFVTETDEGKKKLGELQNAANELGKRVQAAALAEKNITNTNSDDLQKMLDKQEAQRAAAQKQVENETKRLLKEADRQYEDFYKHAQASEDAFNREQIKGVDARVKNMIEGLKEQKEAFDANLQDQVIATQGAEKVQEQQIEQAYLKRRITQQQEIAMIAKAKQDELAVEIEYLRKREELWAGDAKKIEEFEKQITKLQQQSALITAKVETDSLKARQQQYQQLFSQVTSGINSSLNGWIQGTQTAAQAFSKMYAGILTGLFDFVEKWIEKKIEMWLMDKIAGDVADTSAISGSAARGAAATYADMAELGPVGLAAAPAAAAASFADIMAFDLAKFELGGIVPATGLALVHQGEKILPASMSGTGAGLGGLHVHLHIHAIDGQDAANFIGKNSRSIAGAVHKELKKKGFNGQ